jgi:hypothetical protein
MIGNFLQIGRMSACPNPIMPDWACVEVIVISIAAVA